MRDFAVVPGAAAEDAAHAIADELLGSAFVARSQLAGSFQASRGFAVIFTHAGVEPLYARFPVVAPFVRELLDGAGTRALASWTDRFASRKAPNAFYLNLLVLPPGGEIAPHVDATLRDLCGVDDAVPELVSVLYLRAPPAGGGELWLYDGAAPVGAIEPVPGAAVHFRGDLRHEVRAFESDDEDALRTSLVCEQYAFDDDVLARLPSFRIHSKAGFSAYLR